jgi:glycosyltransferase involved in cell wall biosynthesis
LGGEQVSKTLVVVVAARISEWSEKGETPLGYFNPRNGFSRIIVVSLIADSPSPADLQKLAGSAVVEFHAVNLLSWHGLAKTCFLPRLVERYLGDHLDLKLERHPKVAIRAYGDTFAGMVAALLGDHFVCRSVASIHTTHTRTPKSTRWSLKQRFLRLLEDLARKYTHANVDYLAPVYSAALETIAQPHRKKTHVIPNAVSIKNSNIKNSYDSCEVLNLITVGRLIRGKSVFPILSAVEQSPNFKLTIIGDGPERPSVKKWIEQQNISDRVKLIPRVDNHLLMEDLKHYDAFVGYTEYSEVPKTVIEAGLVGLPIILNNQSRNNANEYRDSPILWTDGSPASYKIILAKIQTDTSFREEIGKKIRKQFEQVFAPSACSERMFRLLTDDNYG